MSQPILRVPEEKSAYRRRNVNQQHQNQRLRHGKPHHGHRVHRSQRNDRRNPALIEESRQRQKPEILKPRQNLHGCCRFGKCFKKTVRRRFDRRLRFTALLHPKEKRERRHGKNRRRHRPRRRHHVAFRVPQGSPDGKKPQAQRKRHEPPAVSQGPAPARHTPQGVFFGQLRQKGRIETLTHGVTDVAHDDEERRQNDRPFAAEQQSGGRQNADRRRPEKPPFFIALTIRGPTDAGHHDETDEITCRHHRRPEKRRPVGIPTDRSHKISIEYRRQHHGAVAGIGGVKKRPPPDFPNGDAVF